MDGEWVPLSAQFFREVAVDIMRQPYGGFLKYPKKIIPFFNGIFYEISRFLLGSPIYGKYSYILSMDFLTPTELSLGGPTSYGIKIVLIFRSCKSGDFK